MEIPSHIVAPAGIELRQSEVDTSQMGAWCVTPIAKGTIFGPYVGEIVNNHKGKNIDYRFSWEVFDLEKNELSHIIDATDPMKGNWMRYVNCARFLEEQNIVSVQDNGQVFYKAIQDVDPQKELLTWFQPFKKRRRRRKNTDMVDKDAAVPAKITIKSLPRVKTPSKAKSVAMGTETVTTKASFSKITKETPLTESATSVTAAAGPVSIATTTSTPNYIDSPIQILETKRQRKKKKLFDEDILLTDLVFKKKRHRRSKEEIERDNMEASLNSQTKGKQKRGRKKKSETMIQEEMPAESKKADEEHAGREDSPMKACSVLEDLEEVEGNTVESLEKSWSYPAKHLEYLFTLGPHFSITQNGRRVYRCDVCAGVYKHTFSLKRHYLRNHINCRYLSRADITNCMILIGQQQLAILKSNKKDLLQKVDNILSQTNKEEESKVQEKSESEMLKTGQENSEKDSIDRVRDQEVESNKISDSPECNLQEPQQTPEQSEEIKKENTTEESSPSNNTLTSMTGLYKCNICYRLFDEIEALKLHTKDHPKFLDVKGFACDKCEMRFTYKQNLVRHQMVHEGENDRTAKSLPTSPAKSKSKLGEKKLPVIGKPFKCPRCPMKFKYTTNLERHEALHFADRSYICSYCGKGFPSATNMKKHEHIHLGSRVPCKYCTAVFVHVGSLRKHIRLEHPDIHRQRLLKLLEKRGKLGTKAARTLQESYQKDVTNTFQKKPSQIVQHMKMIKEGRKGPIREDSNSKFKFSCLICKKRFSAYVNMCRHRRLAHKDNGEIPRLSQNPVKPQPIPAKPKRQLSRLRILMGSPKRDEEPIVFETANDPIDDSPEANVNFYANVAANIAENLTSYIDGGEASMAQFKQHIRIKDYDSVFTTAKEDKCHEEENSNVDDKLQWEKFNFPPNYDPKVIADNFMDLSELTPLQTEPVEDDFGFQDKAPALCTRRRRSREGLSSAENSRDGFESVHFKSKSPQDQHEMKEIKTDLNDKDLEREKKGNEEGKSEVFKTVLKLPLLMSLDATAIKTEPLEKDDSCRSNDHKKHQVECGNDIDVSLQNNIGSGYSDILSQTGSEQLNHNENDRTTVDENAVPWNTKATRSTTDSVRTTVDENAVPWNSKSTRSTTDSVDDEMDETEKLNTYESSYKVEEMEKLSSVDLKDGIEMTEKVILEEEKAEMEKTEKVSLEEVKAEMEKTEKVSLEEVKVEMEKTEEVSLEEVKVEMEKTEKVSLEMKDEIKTEDVILETKDEIIRREEVILEEVQDKMEKTEKVSLGNMSEVEEKLSSEQCPNIINNNELEDKSENVIQMEKNSSDGLMISNVVGREDAAELWCHETLNSSSPDITETSTVDVNRNNNSTDNLNLCPSDDNSGYSSPGVYNPPLSPDSDSNQDFSKYGAVSAAQLIQGLNLAKARQTWQENNATREDKMRSAERIYRSLLQLKENQPEPHSPLHNFDSIAFGNFGKRAYVCSVCMRHFSDNEAVLRHQWKKHPLVACHTLEIEDGHDIEYLYYTQPTNVGILGACGKALENVLDRNAYTCTRCNGSFKNIDRLHIHIMNCAPKTSSTSEILDKLPRKRKRKFPKKFIGMELMESKTTEQDEHDKLEELSRNYIAKLKAQKKIFLGCKKHKMADVPIGENSNDTKMRRRRSYEIGYNPGNHVRRREMTELLDTHQCKGCGVKFKSISLLERHVRKCDGKEKFKDLKVMKSTVNESFHKKHKQMCLYCQRGFAYPKTLMNHYRAFCVVKKDKLLSGTLTEAERITEAEMVVRLKQQDEDRNEAVSVHHMEEVEGHRKGWPKGLKRKSRRKNHCWTYIKKRKSSNDAQDIDEDDNLSETASQVSSDSPSKYSDSSSLVSSQKSMESLKLLNLPERTITASTKSNGKESKETDTSTVLCEVSKERTVSDRKPVQIKIEPLDCIETVKPADYSGGRKPEQNGNIEKLSTQNMGTMVNHVTDKSASNGDTTRVKGVEYDGNTTSDCKLVKYSADTVSPASDQPVLNVKATSPAKCPVGDRTWSQGSTQNKTVQKSPKKVNKSEQLSSIGVVKTEPVIMKPASTVPVYHATAASELSSGNGKQASLLLSGASNITTKSPEKNTRKKSNKTQISKQDSTVRQKQNSGNLSLNDKAKNSPTKSKGIGFTAKTLPAKVEKHSTVVLNCPDLSKVVGNTNFLKKASPRKKTKQFELPKQVNVSLHQNLSSISSTNLSKSVIQKESVTVRSETQTLCADPTLKGHKNKPCNVTSSVCTKAKPIQENQLPGRHRISDTAKSELIGKDSSNASCGAETLAKYDDAHEKVLCKTEKAVGEQVLNKSEEERNKDSTKSQQVILHLGTEQFCVALPNSAISSVLKTTTKVNKASEVQSTKPISKHDLRETTHEKEKKEKKSDNIAVKPLSCPQKVTPKTSKVLMGSGKISNVRWPVKKSLVPLDEVSKGNNLTASVMSKNSVGKQLNMTDKACVDKPSRNNDTDNIEKSTKKQQKQTPKQQKQHQPTNNLGNISKESKTLLYSTKEGLATDIGQTSLNVCTMSPPVNAQIDGDIIHSGQTITDQSAALSSSVTTLPQVMSDKKEKSTRKRRKTTPKIDVSMPESKITKCVQNSAKLSMSPELTPTLVSKVNPSTHTASKDKPIKVKILDDNVSEVKVIEDFDQLAPMNNLLQLACVATDVLKSVVGSDEEEKSTVNNSKPSSFQNESVQKQPSKTLASQDLTTNIASLDSNCVQQKQSNSQTHKISSSATSVKPPHVKEMQGKMDATGVIPISTDKLNTSTNQVKASQRKKRVSRSPMKLATREELLNKCGLTPHTEMFTNTIIVKGDNPESKGDKS
ncbi:uncharacterized protein [Argopecten irradians]|uniref:uncharacterized protein n=1 Tax=Argopecten irradians TaxID=31199 RepID=UPI00371C56B0